MSSSSTLCSTNIRGWCDVRATERVPCLLSLLYHHPRHPSSPSSRLPPCGSAASPYLLLRRETRQVNEPFRFVVRARTPTVVQQPLTRPSLAANASWRCILPCLEYTLLLGRNSGVWGSSARTRGLGTLSTLWRLDADRPPPSPPSLQTRVGGASSPAWSIHSCWGGTRVCGARQREREDWGPSRPSGDSTPTDRPPRCKIEPRGWSPIDFEQGEPLLGVFASTTRA
ncbi:hypothetical protein CVT26_004181 [Gymnopilus dilepis]|uniref:Uncharacterized protein n=1 Tax=Gymnopilus dilepis TaxID=231916 RepID=A0A409YNS6_9AGAR|nr:hypothetical protein CVT26_004181 [Gymnopilus dilepis]